MKSILSGLRSGWRVLRVELQTDTTDNITSSANPGGKNLGGYEVLVTHFKPETASCSINACSGTLVPRNSGSPHLSVYKYSQAF